MNNYTANNHNKLKYYIYSCTKHFFILFELIQETVHLRLTTIPVEGLRSSSMMKRYLRARKVARVEGISMHGCEVGEISGCHPLGKMLSRSSSFSECSYNRKWEEI